MRDYSIRSLNTAGRDPGKFAAGAEGTAIVLIRPVIEVKHGIKP